MSLDLCKGCCFRLRPPRVGRYLEVTPHSRLVWTNEEGLDGAPVTTVTFDEKGGKTLLVTHELYPSKEALDAAMASGEKSGMGETFEQLDDLLVALAKSAYRARCELNRRNSSTDASISDLRMETLSTLMPMGKRFSRA